LCAESSWERGMSDIVVFGTGGLAQVTSVCLDKDSKWSVAAYTVHEKYLSEKKLFDRDIVAFERLEHTYPADRYAMIVAIGYAYANKARANIYRECKKKGYTLISYVSSRSVHWGMFDIGDNCLIYENNVINPFVTIGNNVVICPGCIIGHHSVIEDHSFIGSHAAINGNSRIGAYSIIGSNATLADGITIGAESIVGAGAAIMKDTKPQEVYVSPKAERIRTSSTEIGPFIQSPFLKH